MTSVPVGSLPAEHILDPTGNKDCVNSHSIQTARNCCFSLCYASIHFIRPCLRASVPGGSNGTSIDNNIVVAKLFGNARYGCKHLAQDSLCSSFDGLFKPLCPVSCGLATGTTYRAYAILHMLPYALRAIL